MKVGPALNGLSRRRSREWIENQIWNPESAFSRVDDAGLRFAGARDGIASDLLVDTSYCRGRVQKKYGGRLPA